MDNYKDYSKAELIAEIERLEKLNNSLKVKNDGGLLEKIAENYPNSFVSIIEKDLSIGFTSGKEFVKQGLDPKTFIGLSLEQVFAEHAPTVKMHYLKTFKGEEQSFELFINNQYQLYKTVPLNNDSGKIARILVVVENITEKKLAEEKLRDSEEKYKALYENAPLSYQSLTEDGTFKDVNPRWLETLGYEWNEVIGKNYADFLHPDWNEHFEKNFPAFKKRGYVNDVQYKIRHKEGHYIDISFEGCIGYNPDGSFRQTYCVFQDITSRKQAENALLETHARHFAMIENISDIIAIMGTDGMMKYQSPNIEKWFGWKSEDMIGKSGWDNAHPEDIERIQKEFTEILKKETASIVEFRFKCKDGNYKWIELTALNRINEPAINGVLLNYHDITERKQVEKDLQRRELKHQNQANFLDSVIESSPFAMWVSDAKGIMIRANQTLRNMLNLSDDMLIGKYNVLHDKNLNSQGFMSDVEAVFNDLKSIRFTMFWTGAESGDVDLSSANDLWIDVSFFPIIDKAGKLMNVVCQYVDITEQKKAEEMIRESEEKLRLTIDNSPLGVCMNDMQGNFVSTNLAYEKLIGYSKEELGKMSFFDITHADDRLENRNLFDSMSSKKTPGFNMEKKYIRKNGSIINVLVHVGAIHDRQRKPMLGLAFVEDITERKQAENELKKYQENLEELVKKRTKDLEDKNKELERFNDLFIDREFRIKELRDQIEVLEKDK